MASLRYFLLISHLHKIAAFEQFVDLLLRQPQHVVRCLLKLFLLVGVDVRPVTPLRKSRKTGRLAPLNLRSSYPVWRRGKARPFALRRSHRRKTARVLWRKKMIVRTRSICRGPTAQSAA